MNRYRWDTDDFCFFLDSTYEVGEFPILYKGRVVGITEDELKVQLLSDRGVKRKAGQYVSVVRSGCFPTMEALIEALQEHLQGDFNCCPFKTDWLRTMKYESDTRI